MSTKNVPFYQKNKWYSITINPNDKYQFHGTDDRIKRFRDFMYEQFLQLDAYKINYRFNMELSEPRSMPPGHSGPRLHVHGKIQFTSNYSINRFLTLFLYKVSRFASIDIDTIEHPEIWDDYCKKQQHLYKKVSPIFTNSH